MAIHQSYAGAYFLGNGVLALGALDFAAGDENRNFIVLLRLVSEELLALLKGVGLIIVAVAILVGVRINAPVVVIGLIVSSLFIFAFDLFDGFLQSILHILVFSLRTLLEQVLYLLVLLGFVIYFYLFLGEDIQEGHKRVVSWSTSALSKQPLCRCP